MVRTIPTTLNKLLRFAIFEIGEILGLFVDRPWSILPSERELAIRPLSSFRHRLRHSDINSERPREIDDQAWWSSRSLESHESEIVRYYLQFARPVSAFHWRHSWRILFPRGRLLKDTHLHAVSIAPTFQARDNVLPSRDRSILFVLRGFTTCKGDLSNSYAACLDFLPRSPLRMGGYVFCANFLVKKKYLYRGNENRKFPRKSSVIIFIVFFFQ